MPGTQEQIQADRGLAFRRDPRRSRGVQLALVGVIAIAFVGFFVGIQQDSWRTDPTPPHPYPAAVVQEGETDSVAGKDVVPATAYADFDRRAVGPNRGWQSTLAALPRLPQVFDPMDKEEADMEEVDDAQRDEVPDFRTETRRAAALIVRASRRAYEGAPPLVPHPIDQRATSSCLACHADGRRIGNNVVAPTMSHGLLANCTQCHVEQQAADLEREDFSENQFRGYRGSGKGSRAWPGAPPTIPHSILMRENCLSCHGPGGHEPLRTTHPYRTSCLQCHAPSAVLDQQAARQVNSSPQLTNAVAIFPRSMETENAP